MPITQTISIDIKNKVFLENDIIKLLKMIESQQGRDAAYLSIELISTDGIGYQIDKNGIKDVATILEEKKISSLNVTYGGVHHDKRIRVEISTGRYRDSSIELSSSNKAWFNSKRTEFTDYLNSIKSQTNFYIEHRRILLHITRLAIGWLMVPVMLTATNAFMTPIWASIPPIENPPEWLKNIGVILLNPFFSFLFYSVLAYIQGGLFGDALFSRIDKLWPKIELNFGPSHLNRTEAKRKAVGYAVTVVIIPIILSTVFFLVTLR